MGYQHSGGVKAFLSGVSDMFSNHVMLNMRGTHSVPTSIGVIMSLLVILLVLGSGGYSTYKMVAKQQPQILQLTEFESDPTIVHLNKTNHFNFAVALQIGDDYVDLTKEALLTWTMTANRYIRNGSTKKKIKHKILFAPCSRTDFPENIFGENSYDDYFLNMAYCPTGINYALDDGTCPPEFSKLYKDCIGPTDFILQGSYLSKEFDTIQASFYVCDALNKKLDFPSKLKCLGINEIKQKFKEDAEIKVNLYYTNNKIDVGSYEAPLKTYFDVMHWRVDNRIVKWSDIFMDKAVIQDHAYYISPAGVNITSYTIDSSQVREQQTIVEDEVKGAPLIKFNIRRSAFNLVTNRIYLKIQDILGQIGGLTKSLLFFTAFFVVGYAKYKYNMVLSNMLYDFETSEIKEIRRQTRVNDQSMSKPLLDEENKRSLSVLSTKDPKQYVKEYFTYQENKKKGLKYNEGNYLRSLCFWKGKTTDQKLAEKAWERSEEDVDLILILKKLREIDKLKALILDPSQRELFNYNPKPVIKEGREEDSAVVQEGLGEEAENLFESNEEHNSVKHYGKLFIAWREAKNNQDPTKEDCNNKLLHMLCPQLKRLFEIVDQEIPVDATAEDFESVIKEMTTNEEDREEDEEKYVLDASKDVIL